MDSDTNNTSKDNSNSTSSNNDNTNSTTSGGGPRGGSKPIFWVAVVLGILGAGFIAILATRDTSGARSVASPLLGNVAPPIVGSTLDGGSYDLDDQRGRWTVVNFFSPTCVPCVVEHPELIEFDERGGPTGSAGVVSVPFATTEAEVAEFFDRQGGDWPVIAGDTGSIVLDYVTAQVPESFVVDPGGRVVAKLVGGITAAQLDGVIIEAAQGSP